MNAENINEALKELKRNLTILFILNKLIDSILLFLVLLFVVTLLKLSPFYPFVISIVYFVYSFIKQVSSNKIRIVEKKYKSMDEKLRTASEYANSDNRIVKELHFEVLENLKSVKQSSFFSQKNYLKAAFIVILSAVVSFSAAVDLNIEEVLPFDLAEKINVSKNTYESEISIHILTLTDQGTTLKKLSGSLYGKSSVAKLGNEELKIKIRPAGTELDVRTIQESDLPDFSEEYPKEIASVSTESYEESISREDIEIVKEYFNKISEINNKGS